MLSLAYGEEQTDSMRVNSPEVCYPAQGVALAKASRKLVAVSTRQIPVAQVVATLSNRVDPMTYSISVGDTVVEPDTSRKFAQLRYGFKGLIPDGLLLRVSSIDAEKNKAFEIQEEFQQSLEKSLNADNRRIMFGIR